MMQSRADFFLKISKAWKLAPATFESNGHKISEPDILICELTLQLMIDLSRGDLQSLLEAIESKTAMQETVSTRGSSLNKCFTCGKKVEFETDGLTVRSKESCAYPDGIPLTFELNVPSGIMVVANHLHPHFYVESDYSVNTEIGCVQRSKAMEAIGCASAYVGDSCPGVYRIKEDEYSISTPGYNNRDEEVAPEGVHVAGIGTDLWWYSIVDGDEFERRGCEGQYPDANKMQVRPGVYLFTHFQNLNHENDDSEPFMHTSIEWVRPPDPLKNYNEKGSKKT